MCVENYSKVILLVKTYKFDHRDMYSAFEERLAYNEEWDETAELTTVRLREGMVSFLGHGLYYSTYDNSYYNFFLYFYIFL